MCPGLFQQACKRFFIVCVMVCNSPADNRRRFGKSICDILREHPHLEFHAARLLCDLLLVQYVLTYCAGCGSGRDCGAATGRMFSTLCIMHWARRGTLIPPSVTALHIGSGHTGEMHSLDDPVYTGPSRLVLGRRQTKPEVSFYFSSSSRNKRLLTYDTLDLENFPSMLRPNLRANLLEALGRLVRADLLCIKLQRNSSCVTSCI
jgi:hypothetical protein